MTYKQIVTLEIEALRTVRGAVRSEHPVGVRTYAATTAADAMRWLGTAETHWRSGEGRGVAAAAGIGAGLIFKAREELGWGRNRSTAATAEPWRGPSK